ncbi:DUF418 domain-containing protein [Paenibacillus sp. GSMTC-2017]|uniref:DUF418 domain-containing protein n=1 Tax=Paenibacillus sp. GSMTC-2017 TaxID=2794350 RepID=UPI0018D91BC3|nr:DUF418 domain-containing protein [Paenibacillus sp. GSMTC-2017]MBH5319226.1 DUF418 domain-containing protein [Paenibacillus sp. GSMTC-2017]
MNRLELRDRIDELDYLRGFALLGILLLNVISLLKIPVPQPDSMGETYQRMLYLFGEARFFSIFSFLFGIGFYMFISRANDKGHNGMLLFLRRILVMFVFGIIHSYFHPGEALAIYAVCGLLLLPMFKVKRPINLIIGIILMVLFSYTGSKVLLPLPFILLGIAAGQYGVFEQLAKRRKVLIIVTLIMASVAAASLVYQYQQAPTAPFQPYAVAGTGDPIIEQANLYMKIGIWNSAIVSFAYAGILLMLLQARWFRKLLFPMKALGRLALTNYIGQTVLVLVAGHWLNLIGSIGLFESLVLCVGIYIFQMLFSVIWLEYFVMGPLEWIWRAATYLQWPPLRRQKRMMNG